MQLKVCCVLNEVRDLKRTYLCVTLDGAMIALGGSVKVSGFDLESSEGTSYRARIIKQK